MFASILALSIAVVPTPVVPGQSIGPLKLGMTEAQLKTARLTVAPGRFETERKIGDLHARFEGGKIVAISVEVTGPLKIGDRSVPTPKTPQAIAAVTQGCTPLEMRIGGNIIECTSGVVIARHRGGMTLTVQAPSTHTSKPLCDAYLEPGNPASRIDVKEGKTYCLPTRVVTTAITEADVLGKLRYNTCQTQRNRGATIVTCPFQGTRFTFAGPAGALHAVSGVPMKTE